jgi:hypothetical protein
MAVAGVDAAVGAGAERRSAWDWGSRLQRPTTGTAILTMVTGTLPIPIRLRIMVVTTLHVTTRVVTIITDDAEGHRELSKA